MKPRTVILTVGTVILLASCSVPRYIPRALRYDRRSPPPLMAPEFLVEAIPAPVPPVYLSVRVPDFAFPLDVPHRISSGYGTRSQVIPGMGGEDGDFHRGVDLVAPRGTPILAAADGIVLMHYPPPNRFYKGHPVFGGMVVLRHEHGFYTVYGHLSRTSVREGHPVRKGQELGIIGNTGRSTGTHLHFEIGFDPMLFFEISY